jgi:3-dehydrotetronate 4-kinase
MTGRLLFAAVADDDTGASDLAGMLAEHGLRTLLIIDLPTVNQFLEWSDGHQAVVMAEGTRNLSPLAAKERTRAALKILEARDPRVLQIKYCSTFDSTPEGNIGLTIDAAMDELNEDFTVALPALPVNGRTTYQGYHFVHGQILSDSPMRDHPLTPMTNPNLVDLLGRQTAHRVGLASYDDVAAGPERLRRRFQELKAQGVGIALTDCLSDEHLETISRASADLRLITGSSAFGMKLPAVWRERGWFEEQSVQVEPQIPDKGRGKTGCLIVAGSCSVATRGQNEWLTAQGTDAHHIDPQALVEGAFDHETLAEKVRGQLRTGKNCLLSTTATPAEVCRMQEWGAGKGLTVSDLGQLIANALADVVLEILPGQTSAGLIIAGGETSGALCRRLELGALRVGRNIVPGVPLCFSLGRFRLPIVLKSGNFGGTDFYGRALRAVAHPTEYFI